MNNNKSRRSFVKNVSGIFTLSMLSDLVQASPSGKNAAKTILCVGGHPDDPESGCGGTLAKFANAGHKVIVIYLTTGERGIKGKSYSEAATIRKQEAINACKVLNAKPVFAGQINGDIILNNEWLIKMRDIIISAKPDIVFTHWPLDSHMDHQVASVLTTQVWMSAEQPFSLYYFEVLTGIQSMGFHPTDYVDITDTQSQKSKSVYCHISQHPAEIYSDGHAAMELFRGQEFGVKYAEAFVRATGRGWGEISSGA